MEHLVQKINNVDFPIYSGKVTKCDISYHDLDGNTYRAVDATLIRNFLGTKVKFQIEYRQLTKAQLVYLVNLIRSEHFSVSYFDLRTAETSIGTFYSSADKEPIISSYENGGPIFDSFKFSLVEY